MTTLSDHMEHRRPVLIAGPNLTIDRTLTIEELRPGEVLRFDGVAVTPGGKGVNVARVARALGAPALLVGFTPGRTGAAAAELIADEGLRIEPVPTAGELRSTAVILERGGRVTVMNEPGPAIGPRGLGALRGGGRLATRGQRRARLQRKRAPGNAAGRLRTTRRTGSSCRRGRDRGRVRSLARRRASEPSRRRLPEPRRGRGAAARVGPTRRSSPGIPARRGRGRRTPPSSWSIAARAPRW